MVDTSVVLAQSPFKEFPPPKSRLLLTLILQVCHKVIFSEKLMKEYIKYRVWDNYFMRSWRFEMSQRGKWIPAEHAKFNEKMRRFSGQLNHHDSHLVCLAMLGDRIVVSSDRSAIEHFKNIAQAQNSFGNLIFINPRHLSEGEIDTLLQYGLLEKSK